jgi:hypothetical protein
MEGATHFIEQYKTYPGEYSESGGKIKNLIEALNTTKEVGFKTIAVWQIKIKTKK